MVKRICGVLALSLYCACRGFSQKLPYDVLNSDQRYQEVSYSVELRGRFYYYNDEVSSDGRGGASFGTMEHSRTVTRKVDFSADWISIAETDKNDSDVNWAEMKPAFLFPAASMWKEIPDPYQGAFSANFRAKLGVTDARSVIKGLLGLTPKGDIRISREGKTYKTGIEVRPEIRSTDAIKLYFETDYSFTALDRKRPLKIVAQHWVWLSRDIPGALLERIDQVVFPENSSAPGEYAVQCHYLVERVGSHEELYAEIQGAAEMEEVKELLTERLQYLEGLRRKKKADYNRVVDSLLWEIVDALDAAKESYPDLYQELRRKYPVEMDYYESNIAVHGDMEDSDSLIDAFGLGGEDSIYEEMDE